MLRLHLLEHLLGMYAYEKKKHPLSNNPFPNDPKFHIRKKYSQIPNASVKKSVKYSYGKKGKGPPLSKIQVKL